MIAKLVAWLLRQDLSVKNRGILMNAVINSLDTVPLRAMISTDENRRVLVQGKLLSPEQAISLRESATSLLNNQAMKLIREQVRFAAIDQGFLQNEKADPYRELFYKAALWYAQSERELVEAIAGSQDLPLSEDLNAP